MVLGLRFSGWACFLVGAVIFLFSGGFQDPRNPVAWIGLFTALLGMILTSSSNLAAHIVRMRKLKEEAAQRKASPPSPPAGPD